MSRYKNLKYMRQCLFHYIILWRAFDRCWVYKELFFTGFFPLVFHGWNKFYRFWKTWGWVTECEFLGNFKWFNTRLLMFKSSRLDQNLKHPRKVLSWYVFDFVNLRGFIYYKPPLWPMCLVFYFLLLLFFFIKLK